MVNEKMNVDLINTNKYYFDKLNPQEQKKSN
jgi:hypothetical protein